jgi:hypothetical protein
MSLADPPHRTTKGLSFDPYALMLAYLALTLAYLGYIDQARSRMKEAISEARRIGPSPYAGSRVVFFELAGLAYLFAYNAR